MPIAAVPAYLGNDFSHASPGLRFGMYLKLWGINNRDRKLLWTTHDISYRKAGRDHQGPQFKDENKVSALNEAKLITSQDKSTMTAIAARQAALADTVPEAGLLHLAARSTAPFTTGLGNEHPLENGFAFLNPYGLPYLPGSGVKGVLRQAARELASGEWGDTHGWSDEKNIPLMQGEGDKRKPVLDSKKRPIILSMLDILFGRETPDGDSEHLRGVLSFWDIIPQIEGDSLMVEIMTPHQSHYYQWKKDQRGNLIEVSPHDSGQPNPISFLTVPPGSKFTFHVVCDLRQLQRLTADRLEGAPDLLAEGDTHWKKLLEAAFEHAFAWLGFGAKTAVGYGAMARDREAEAHAARQAALIQQQEEAKAQREAELAKLSPLEREIAELLEQRPDKNQTEISAVISAVKQGRWKGEDKIAVANWLKVRMQATKGQWKETSQAKRPEKDKEYQNTLKVKEWLEGK